MISELVADGFGMDVAWKTFKKLGLASQAKLIGFKDYPIDKLFFQTVAVVFFIEFFLILKKFHFRTYAINAVRKMWTLQFNSIPTLQIVFV